MQPQTSKFKSAFGDTDGSQINPKKHLKGSRSQLSFHDSQHLDHSQLKDVSNVGGVLGAPKNLAKRAAATLLPRVTGQSEGYSDNNYDTSKQEDQELSQPRNASHSNSRQRNDTNYEQEAQYQQEEELPNQVPEGHDELDHSYDNHSSSHRPGTFLPKGS